MATVAEITVEEEIVAVRDNAAARGWGLRELDALHFSLDLPAGDGTRFYLLVDCTDYPVMPPAWHWCDSEGKGIDQRTNAPKGVGYLHENGVICAPWNRLAYKAVDPRGPHGDWTIADWRKNAKTEGCKTLGAMALRIFVELNGPRFHKQRLAA